MSLTKELELLTVELNTPFDIMNAFERSIKDLQASGLVCGVQEGSKSRDFTLYNHINEEVNLYTELSKGPVILTFYRGSWCPYCNRQLRAYQEILPEIKKIGAQLIAISPELPDHSLTIQEKNNLEFTVLSDPKGVVSAKYNIIYDVPEYLKQAYQKAGLNLENFYGIENWLLPVPATIMIDESGIVRFNHVNPNFMERLEPHDFLEKLLDL